jgi:hypothetical protein
MSQTLVSYFLGVPYEGGFMGIMGEDGEPLRANIREDLLELVDDVKDDYPELYIIQEITIAEKIHKGV